MSTWLRKAHDRIDEPLGLEPLFEQFDRLGPADLMVIGAAVRIPSAELIAARRTATRALTPQDETTLQRGRDALVRWATTPQYAMRVLIAPALFGSSDQQTDVTRLRREAAPALEDALVATLLGDRLDPMTHDTMMAAASID